MTNVIVAIFILTGAAFMLISSIGLLRFPDLYSRLHATTKASSFGILLLLIGVALWFNSFGVYIKALLIIIFIYATAPLAAHTIITSFSRYKKNKDVKEKLRK